MAIWFEHEVNFSFRENLQAHKRYRWAIYAAQFTSAVDGHCPRPAACTIPLVARSTSHWLSVLVEGHLSFLSKFWSPWSDDFGSWACAGL